MDEKICVTMTAPAEFVAARESKKISRSGRDLGKFTNMIPKEGTDESGSRITTKVTVGERVIYSGDGGI